MKRFKRSRKIRWRNPDIDLDRHLGELTLIILLFTGSKKVLSNRISELKIRNLYCDDCKSIYYDCTCEGSTKTPGLPCEDCDQNRCICDYNLKDKEDVARFAWNIIKNKKLRTFNDIMNRISKIILDPNENINLTNLAKKVIVAISQGKSSDEIRKIN